jgi:hypothetical protein
MLRRGNLPLAPAEAWATGMEMGRRLRLSSTLEESMRLMALVINTVSRGGAPGGRLRVSLPPDKALALPPSADPDPEEEFEEPLDPQQVHSMKMGDIKSMIHRGDWADDEVESQSEASSFGKINVADVIEAHDEEVSANDLTMASKLTRMSVKDVRALAEAMSEDMPHVGNPTLFLAAGMCLTLSRDLIATQIVDQNLATGTTFSHVGWEDMGPAGVLFANPHLDPGKDNKLGLLSKRGFSAVMEMARVGIRPAGELANQLATAGRPTTMGEALAGILDPEQAEREPTFEEVMLNLSMLGMQFHEKDPAPGDDMYASD